MTCPDFETYLGLKDEDPLNEDLRAHMEGCPNCRAEVVILRALAKELNPTEDVPEALKRRVVKSIEEARAVEEQERVAVRQLVWSGALGALTVLGTLVVTGAAGSGGPVTFAVVGLAAGAVTGIAQLFGHRRDQQRPKETTTPARV